MQILQHRERRHSRYEQVMELARQGTATKKIARALGIDRRTVRRWIYSEGFPERKAVYRSSSVDAHASYLDLRWQQGCHNATQLWRELKELNFRGQVNIVRRWLRRRYGLRSEEREHIAKPPLTRASPRHTAWLMLTEPASASAYLEELYRQSPQIAAAANAAREFVRIIRNRDVTAWHNWTLTVKTTSLANFAAHLVRDQDAVLAALRLPWNNGPVEGHVHRLKLIKRQMYGRANFDLLRLRVLNAT